MHRERKRLLGLVEALADQLKEDAPDCILEAQVAMVWVSATAVLGAGLYGHLGRRAAEDARQRCGMCQDCGADIPAELTHPPVCPGCDEIREGEADVIQAEMKYRPEADHGHE